MKEGIIENVVRKEIDRHYSNVFTEFKIDILLTKDKIAGIYLGPLERSVSYEQERGIISKGKRKIDIKINCLNPPVTASWLEKGFDFFGKLGEKDINLRWEHCLDRIKTSKKEKDIIELIRDFEKKEGKQLCYDYFDSTPSFWIKDEINKVKEFINDYKKAINLDEAILSNYRSQEGYMINISKHIFGLEISGTNLDAKKYAKMVDEFLGA